MEAAYVPIPKERSGDSVLDRRKGLACSGAGCFKRVRALNGDAQSWLRTYLGPVKSPRTSNVAKTWQIPIHPQRRASARGTTPETSWPGLACSIDARWHDHDHDGPLYAQISTSRPTKDGHLTRMRSSPSTGWRRPIGCAQRNGAAKRWIILTKHLFGIDSSGRGNAGQQAIGINHTMPIPAFGSAPQQDR